MNCAFSVSCTLSLVLTTAPAFLDPVRGDEAEARSPANNWQIAGIDAALQDQHRGVKELALKKLQQLLPVPTLENKVLELALDSAQPYEVRRLALEALGRWGQITPTTATALRERATTTDDEHLRAGMIAVLRRCNQIASSTRQILWELIDGSPDAVAKESAIALVKASASDVPTLDKLLKHSNLHVRATAAFSVGELDRVDAPIIDLLRSMATIPKEERSQVQTGDEAWLRNSVHAAAVGSLARLHAAVETTLDTALWLDKQQLEVNAGDRRKLLHLLFEEVYGADMTKGDLRKLLPMLSQPVYSAARTEVVEFRFAPTLGDDEVADAAASTLIKAFEHDARTLKELTRNADWHVQAHAVRALGNLGSRDAETMNCLRHVLENGEAVASDAAAEAIVTLHARDEAALRALLCDNERVRDHAIDALGKLTRVDSATVTELERLAAKKDQFGRIPVLTALFAVSKTDEARLRGWLQNTDELFRQGAAAAIGNLKKADVQTVAALRDRLTDPNEGVRRNAAEALGKLGANDEDALAALVERLNDADTDVQLKAARALVSLGQTHPLIPRAAVNQMARGIPDHKAPQLEAFIEHVVMQSKPDSVDSRMPFVLAFLAHIDEDTRGRDACRWLAHYSGGDFPAAKRINEFLGRPSTVPTLSGKRASAVELLPIFLRAWDKTDSQQLGQAKTDSTQRLRREMAHWMWKVVTQAVKDWDAKEDTKLLQEVESRVRADAEAAGLAGDVKEIIDRINTRPSPHVRSLIALVVVNLLVLVTVRWPMDWSGFEKWLAVFGVGLSGGGIWTFGETWNLDFGWFFTPLAVEVVAVIFLCAVSPPVLQFFGHVEPVRSVLVPAVIRFRPTRRRLFGRYLADVTSALANARKSQEQLEKYMPIPSTIRESPAVAPRESAEPVPELLSHILEGRGHVVIEAGGGRGKSALLRAIVQAVLDSNSAIVPILIGKNGESLELAIRSQIESCLVNSDVIKIHLNKGHFLVVLDGVTEADWTAEQLRSFHNTYGERTKLLLTSRPSAKLDLLRATANTWFVEPCLMNDDTLPKFLKNYGATELKDEHRQACRGPDGYLPLLVRMALRIADKQAATVADIYREYFLALCNGKAQNPRELLARAGALCLATYWKNGERQIRVDPDEDVRHAVPEAVLNIQELLRAGVLVPVGVSPTPQLAQFFHDSMQTFLTAHALADRGDAGFNDLLRAAGDECFGLQPEGTELFRMCLTTFVPQTTLRQRLREEIRGWATHHEENLRRVDVKRALSDELPEDLSRVRVLANLIDKSSEWCLNQDEQAGSVRLTAILHAGLAPLVYPLTLSNEGPIGTPAIDEASE